MFSLESSDLSPRDIRILITLTIENTAYDALQIAGIPHDYGVQRIRHLKKKGLLKERRQGRQIFYKTAQVAETEEFYTVGETRHSASKEFCIIHNGQWVTLPKAIQNHRALYSKGKKYSALLSEVVTEISIMLRIRSFRKANNYASKPPDEEELRTLLLEKVRQTEQELEIAKELLDATELWTGKPTVWSRIRKDEPTSKDLENYEALIKLYGEKEKATQKEALQHSAKWWEILPDNQRFKDLTTGETWHIQENAKDENGNLREDRAPDGTRWPLV